MRYVDNTSCVDTKLFGGGNFFRKCWVGNVFNCVRSTIYQISKFSTAIYMIARFCSNAIPLKADSTDVDEQIHHAIGILLL